MTKLEKIMLDICELYDLRPSEGREITKVVKNMADSMSEKSVRTVVISEKEYDDIVAQLGTRYYINNPSAWESYSEEGSELLRKTHNGIKDLLFLKTQTDL